MNIPADQSEFSIELCDGILDHLPLPEIKIIESEESHRINIAKKKLLQIADLINDTKIVCNDLQNQFDVTDNIYYINEMIHYNLALRKLTNIHKNLQKWIQNAE